MYAARTRLYFLRLLLWCVVSSILRNAHCFASHRQASLFLHQRSKPTTSNCYHRRPPFPTQEFALSNNSPLAIPRGGDTTKLKLAPLATIDKMLLPALQSGPYGTVAIMAVAASAVVPLTIYKQMYSISVGYGLAIFFSGLALRLAFEPAGATSMNIIGQGLTIALMFYGLRLAGYLFLREQTRKTPSPGGASKEGTILKKLSLALSVSVFYAFLTVPALYAMRNVTAIMASAAKLLVTKVGIGLAFAGAILEGVADLQKYIVKQFADNPQKDQFIGPTRLAYRLCRHPNYLGEIVFWFGIFVAGVPSFGTNLLAWIPSALGLYGIVSIMTMATARLEKQHQEKYGGQEKYDKWVKQVKAPLVPFL